MFDTQELRAQVPGEVAGPAQLPLPASAPQPVHVFDRLNAVFKHRRLASVAFLLVVDDDDGAELFHRAGLPGILAGPDSGRAERAGRDAECQRSGVLAGVRAVLPHAVRDHPEPRPGAPGRPAAEPARTARSSTARRRAPRDPVSLARQARAAASTWARGLISARGACRRAAGARRIRAGSAADQRLPRRPGGRARDIDAPRQDHLQAQQSAVRRARRQHDRARSTRSRTSTSAWPTPTRRSSGSARSSSGTRRS